MYLKNSFLLIKGKVKIFIENEKNIILNSPNAFKYGDKNLLSLYNSVIIVLNVKDIN